MQIPNYRALSIRQPWAHLIVHKGKNIENRKWKTNYRGWFLIHASKGMTRQEYADVQEFCGDGIMGAEALVPPKEELQFGGIIGMAKIVHCVPHHNSPWFMGPFGFWLEEVKPLPFTPCRGALGFFWPKLQSITPKP